MRSRVPLALLTGALVAALTAPTASATGSPPHVVGGDRLATTGVVVDAPGAEPLPKLDEVDAARIHRQIV